MLIALVSFLHPDFRLPFNLVGIALLMIRNGLITRLYNRKLKNLEIIRKVGKIMTGTVVSDVNWKKEAV